MIAGIETKKSGEVAKIRWRNKHLDWHVDCLLSYNNLHRKWRDILIKARPETKPLDIVENAKCSWTNVIVQRLLLWQAAMKMTSIPCSSKRSWLAWRIHRKASTSVAIGAWKTGSITRRSSARGWVCWNEWKSTTDLRFSIWPTMLYSIPSGGTTISSRAGAPRYRKPPQWSGM